MSGLGTGVTATQAVISLRSYMTPQGPTQTTLVNTTTPDSFTADAADTITRSIAASATNQSFNLATLFPACTAPVFVCIADVSSPGVGFAITTVSGSGKMGIMASYWMAYMANGTTALPTVYIDNPSSTQSLILQISVMTQ